MVRREREQVGSLLAVALVALVAGCREPVARPGDGQAGPPGASGGGMRIALSEQAPQAAAPGAEGTGERVEEPVSGVPPAAPPPAPVGLPPGAVDLPPPAESPEEKAAEWKQDEDGAALAPTRGGAGRLPPRTAPAPEQTRETRAGDDEDWTVSRQGGGAELAGGGASTTTVVGSRRASADAPLPPPPPSPPAVSPGTLAAPTVPAPAALPSAGTAPDGAERTVAVRSGGGLPASTVRALLRRREAALQRCYDGLLLRAPGTGSGSFSVLLRIRTTGEVERVERVGGTLEDADFERCVLDQLRRVDFPAADTPTVFTHSFQFAPSGAAAPLTE